MKSQLLLLTSGFLLFSLHLNAQKQIKSADEPYTLQFNNVKIGNLAYAQKVLQAWKQYDNNQMDAVTPLLADNVVGYFSDGTVVRGADNLNKLFRAVRNNYASINEDVYACTTLKSQDAPEHEFVVIWGLETDTKKDGSIQKTRIHEVWRFNNEGKADECTQYVIPENTGDDAEGQVAPVRNDGQTYPILKDLNLGNPVYSEIVLKVWKDFENNSFDNSRTDFTQDVVLYLPDGAVVKGQENMFSGSQYYRNSLKEVKFKIVACTTLKSPNDSDHEIVMIWAERNYTNQNGTVQKTLAQEAWYFNKQGKIDKVYQFSAAMPVDNN